MFLTGCQEKEGTISCDLSSNDVISGYKLESNYKLNYKGDYVTSVETVESVTSDNKDIIDVFNSTFEETYKTMQANYGGYTYNISNENGKVTAKVTIDYEKMNLSKFIEDQPTMKDYSKNGKLLVDEIKAIYESTGATCK